MDSAGAPGPFSALADAIHARSLARDLAQAMAFAPEDEAAAAAERMAEAQFDYAPVLGSSGPIGVFQATAASAGSTVGEAMRPLDGRLVVSGDTDVARLVRYLADEPFLFLLAGRDLVGFVTPADMSVPQARTYLYLVLANLEIDLAHLVRYLYPDQEQALAGLGTNRAEQVRALLEELRERDSLVDPVGAMQLADLMKVLGKTDFREHAENKGIRYAWLRDEIGIFRNHVMHVVREFPYATPREMPKLAALTDAVERTAPAAQEYAAARTSGRPRP